MFFYFLFFFKKLLLFPVFRVLTFLKPFPKTQTQTKPNETNQRTNEYTMCYLSTIHSFIHLCLFSFWVFCSHVPYTFFPKPNKQTNKHHHVLLLLFSFFFFPLPTNQPTNRPPLFRDYCKRNRQSRQTAAITLQNRQVGRYLGIYLPT